jgi:hypothetical protein
MSPDLKASVEEIYDVFASYRLPERTYARNEEDERKLHSKPLRMLNKDDLWLYAADAILVWGDENVYRHFLPRMFELLADAIDSPRSFQDVSICLLRLHYGNWRLWPAKEQRAIERFALVISTYPPQLCNDAENWLSGIAQAVHDLRPYLDIWQADESEQSCQNLAAIVLEHNFIQPGAHGTEFWADRKHQFGQVRAWLLSRPVKKKLETAFLRNPIEQLEMACTVLP